MMRKFIVFAVLSPLVLQVVAMEPAMEDAIRHGAMAKICYRVIDDEGCPVSNAVAHVWFSSYARHQDDADWLVTTDTNGMFTVEHRTNESLDCGFDKDGYYHSSDQILFRDRKDVPVKVKDGKWQPYGETRTVVLKKIRDPWGVKVFNEQCHRRAIPAFGRWMGFDLENGDWTSPYGSGHVEDVLLRFKADVRKHRIDYTYVMDVCFTNNPYAGAYLGKKDRGSDLMSEYVADTNVSYQAEFSFVTDSVKDERVKSNYLDQDSYLVFRTRTRVDDEGRLVGAHYGKIYGIWRSTHQRMYLNDGCFNPKENDTNIEGDQELLYKIKNCRKER